ncbi:hypothetical protein FA15DRAFT_461723 [Coprinopsis marcescibilis]|uniref:Uncharacterized protein n=1 Tax=Coprinopsis marcescibilis TaxID=230819 RepID=A0A5C3KTI0_COPMA|nr:hypothetical protein FA15DRAFT_461723 [Coprinopsis marcescibilis]
MDSSPLAAPSSTFSFPPRPLETLPIDGPEPAPPVNETSPTIGIAVGSSLGGLFVIASVIIYLFWRRRRRRARLDRSKSPGNISPFVSSTDDFMISAQALPASPPMCVVDLAPVIKQRNGSPSKSAVVSLDTTPTQPRSDARNVEINAAIADPQMTVNTV